MKELTNLRSERSLKKVKNILEEQKDFYKNFIHLDPQYDEKVAFQIIEEAYELSKENQLSSLVIYDINFDSEIEDVIDVLSRYEINDFILEHVDYYAEDEVVEAILNKGFEAVEPVYLYRDGALSKGYKFERA